MNKEELIIIFSGFNQRAVIAFIRTLILNQLPFVIIARSKEDAILNSIYKNNVCYIRNSIKLEIDEILECIEVLNRKNIAQRYIIMPSTEALNRYLLKNKNILEELNCRIPLVNIEIYEKVSDKKIFGEICKSFGILIPVEIYNLDNTIFPFVAKPKTYFAKDGSIHTPYLIFNEKDKTNFLNNCDPEDFYYQEYINGESYYLLYYFSKTGEVYKFSQQNVVQQPDGKSIIAAISSNFHKTAESNKFENLFKAIGFVGLVMVEVKHLRNKNYMIEANPRFWGPSQLFADAGINLFEAFLVDNGLLNKRLSFIEPQIIIRYFWFGGYIESIIQNKKLMYHSNDDLNLAEELPIWMEADIYRRKDTIEIFKKELFL